MAQTAIEMEFQYFLIPIFMQQVHLPSFGMATECKRPRYEVQRAARRIASKQQPAFRGFKPLTALFWNPTSITLIIRKHECKHECADIGRQTRSKSPKPSSRLFLESSRNILGHFFIKPSCRVQSNSKKFYEILIFVYRCFKRLLSDDGTTISVPS